MRDFDLEFEEQILAQCLEDDEYLRSAARLLDKHHFSSKQHGWVWSAIRDAWIKNKERLTPRLLMSRASRECQDGDERRLTLELGLKLFRIKSTSPRTALEELQEFVKFANLQSAMESSLKDMEKGKLNKAYAIMRKTVMNDFRPREYRVVNWMEEFNERIKAAKKRRDHPETHVFIPTGIKRLDNIVDGIRAGELGIVEATTGRGKSIFMNHLGWHGIIRGFGVLHFSTEMPAEQVAMRYDSRFTGVLHKKFKLYGFTRGDFERIITKTKKNRKRLLKKLKIISIPVNRCNIDMVRNILDEVREEMEVHMVLVDSADHMKSMRRYDQPRFEKAEPYWDLKALAEEEDLRVWSSTQAGREWETKIIHTTGVASEAYDKERIADIVIAINKPGSVTRSTNVVVGGKDPGSGVISNKSSIQDNNRSLELFLTKYRDGEGKLRIPLDVELQRMLIREAAMED